MTKRFLWSAVAALTAIAMPFAASSASANIVPNGGFEVEGANGVTDADGWNQLEIAAGIQGASSTVERVAANASEGTYSMFFEVVGAPDYGPVAEIQQGTPVGSVTAGESYDFSFDVMGNAGPGSVGFYEVFWFDGDGSDGGGVQGGATGLQQFFPGAAYTQLSATNLVAPATADSMFVQIRLVTGAFDGAEGSMYVDNVQITPEPASLMLLALGGLAVIRRR